MPPRIEAPHESDAPHFDATTTAPAGHAWATTCLNCGTGLTGRYCQECGQRAVPPHPSLRELVGDAFVELSGWDGKFIETFRLLALKPGELTRRFIDGQRVRFIAPIRLYLALSLVYFVIAAAIPVATTGPTVTVAGVQVGSADTGNSAPARVARNARAAAQSQQALTGAARDSALRDIARAPSVVRPLLRRVILDPAGLRRGLLETMPRALFALVPVFALIISLFYRRRKFPEHLYFAIYLHAFTFLALIVNALARLSGVHVLENVTALVVLIWIPTYATMAFRRAYGGSMMLTLAKEAAIGTLYVLSGTVALLATIYWVALWG